jgi:chromosome partitioning protein
LVPNVVLVANGKGGVYKTSLVANVAVLAALGGWRVLTVDLDPQGNLARDLGYMDHSDGGAELLSAVTGGRSPVPMSDIRPGLDVLAGGPATDDLVGLLTSKALRDDDDALHLLERSLAPLAGRYHLVLFDAGPSQTWLHRAAMTAARFLVIPTHLDDASIDGLGRVFRLYRSVRSVSNPALEVLGVAITGVQTQATVLLRDVRAQLEELLGNRVPVFSQPVRYAQRAAVDCRARGVVASEYEQQARSAPQWFAAIRRGETPTRFGAVRGLAEDYQRLADEILAAFEARGHHDHLVVVAGE